MSYEPPSQPPPPGSGFQPIPGGYVPPTGYGPGNMGGGGGMPPRTAGNLFQSYLAAVTRPNAATYEAELPLASWSRVLIGVLAAIVISVVFSVVYGALTVNQLEQQLVDTYTKQGMGPDFIQMVHNVFGFVRSVFSPVGALGFLVFYFLLFFIGAGVMYLIAKIFGGQGSFLPHAYGLSLSYTPLRILGAVVGLIPFVGFLVALVLAIYQLYCAGQSMTVSHRLTPGRAQLVAFFPLILLVVGGCLCLVLVVVLAAMSASRS